MKMGDSDGGGGGNRDGSVGGVILMVNCEYDYGRDDHGVMLMVLTLRLC